MIDVSGQMIRAPLAEMCFRSQEELQLEDTMENSGDIACTKVQGTADHMTKEKPSARGADNELGMRVLFRGTFITKTLKTASKAERAPCLRSVWE